MIRTEGGSVEMHGKETEILADVIVIMKAYKDTNEQQGCPRKLIRKALLEAVDIAFKTEEEIKAKRLKLEEEIKKREEKLLSLLSEEDKHNLIKMISVLGCMN